MLHVAGSNFCKRLLTCMEEAILGGDIQPMDYDDELTGEDEMEKKSSTQPAKKKSKQDTLEWKPMQSMTQVHCVPSFTAVRLRTQHIIVR